MRSSKISTTHKTNHFSGDQMMENEMDGARDTCGEEERNTYCICRGRLVEIEHLRRPRSRWQWKIKMCRREIEWRGMDKIHMAKNGDKLVLL